MALAAFLCGAPSAGAAAATLTVTVTDERGAPLPGAVVSVAGAGGTHLAPAAGLQSAVIDQREEEFVPAVVAIARGGTVTFRNSDRTRHHIYSFSAIKRFELVQKPDDTSPPLPFPEAGVAAIGCNIHDHMVAHVYVTDAPRAAVTDGAGRAAVADLPAGDLTVTAWHPRLRPRDASPSQPVRIASAATSLAVTIPVLPPRRSRAPRDGY